MMTNLGARRSIAIGTSIVFALSLSACGSGGGGVSSTPAPPPTVTPPAPPPPPPPPPPPTVNYNTLEYQRSNGAVQAQAIAAYNAGASGNGIIAGVIDSGVDIDSPEFAGKIHAQSGDFAGARGLQDEGGHGTAVSSVLLGAKNDLETHGVAFGATLLVLRTDTPGTCTDPDPDAGCTHNDNNMAQAVDRAVAVGARVVNMSLGGSPMNGTLRAAVDRATAAGVVFVISAGNEFDEEPATAINPDPMAMIALDPIARGQILIAGATDSSQQISTFSNRAGTGQSYYLTALGVRVRAPDEAGTQFLWSGTSFAAPIVAGAVALLAQAFPNLTGRQIVDLLLTTTTDLGATGTDGIYGRGELNLARAFQPQGQQSIAGTPIPVPAGSAARWVTQPAKAARRRLSSTAMAGRSAPTSAVLCWRQNPRQNWPRRSAWGPKCAWLQTSIWR
ncbi:MAG: S8 family serine peptidase [Sphingomonadales bacterium]|nr:S8 family serine peptidase [Sphingomonadales bacterium]MBK9267828.1 S8 family serine peptidase [Sphingomonadales bacterium]